MHLHSKRSLLTVLATRLALVAPVALVALVAPGCDEGGDSAAGAPNAPAIHDVSPAALAGWIEQGDTQVVLVDVRTNFEYVQAHLAGAMLVDPSELSHLQVSDAAKLVVYCGSGMRSREAARRLVGAGRTNVYDLIGGIQAWVAAGQTVQTGPAAAQP